MVVVARPVTVVVRSVSRVVAVPGVMVRSVWARVHDSSVGRFGASRHAAKIPWESI